MYDNLTPENARILSDLLRVIDAYAYDYANEGKLATTRMDVGKALVSVLTNKPRSIADSLPYVDPVKAHLAHCHGCETCNAWGRMLLL